MRNRNQRRSKAILPLKLVSTADGTVLLAHTLDISASGARLVVTTELKAGTTINVEYKHRRTAAKVVWCKAVKGRKYDHEIGLRLENAGNRFWGVNLALREPDHDSTGSNAMPFSQVMSLLSSKQV